MILFYRKCYLAKFIFYGTFATVKEAWPCKARNYKALVFTSKFSDFN